MLPAVGVAASDELRRDGDRKMARAVVVLMVVIKAAGTTVITVHTATATTVHTAATAAVPAHMATIIRDQRQTALLQRCKRHGRRRIHKKILILHHLIHHILLPPDAPPLLLPVLVILASISIPFIVIQHPIFHITPFPLPGLHHSTPLQEQFIVLVLLYVGASRGGREGGIRGERDM